MSSRSSNRASDPTVDDSIYMEKIDELPLLLSGDWCWECCCIIPLCFSIGLVIFTIAGLLLWGPLAYENRFHPITPAPPTTAPTTTPSRATPAPTPEPEPYNNTAAPPLTAPPPSTDPPLPTYPNSTVPINMNVSNPGLGPTMATCVTAADCGPYPNVLSFVCSQATCKIASCNANFADCDLFIYNGCEVDTRTNDTHCGTCRTNCNGNHYHAPCQNSVCNVTGFTCDPGFANCNNDLADGCEINTVTDVFNCGGCTNACPTDKNIAMATCFNGTCGVFSCSGTFANCNSDITDGCETQTAYNPTNCGSCGNLCPSSVSCCDFTTCAYSAGSTAIPINAQCIGEINLATRNCVASSAMDPVACCRNIDCTRDAGKPLCVGNLGIQPNTTGVCSPVPPTPPTPVPT